MRHSAQLVLVPVLLCCLAAFAVAMPSNTVVVCTESNCPVIEPLLQSGEQLQQKAIVYQTSDKPEFMTRYLVNFSAHSNQAWHSIEYDQAKLAKIPAVIGFGGAFSDAAAILYHHLPEALKKTLIRDYFSANGIAYSLGRVPMASSDFSCRSRSESSPQPDAKNCSQQDSVYTYADRRDPNLNHFALQVEDIEYKIPMIKAALRVQPLRLFASPWSAPAWMKTNQHMVHGALLPEYRQTWANYFVKFLAAYKKYGIKFWGLTLQNEPVEGYLGVNDLQTWQTMYYTEQQEADFIKHFLGPTLKAYEKNYGSHLHLMMHDDQLPFMDQRVKILNDPEVRKYVSGVGLHWYLTTDLFTPTLDQTFDSINQFNGDTTRFILGTEACLGSTAMARGPLLGSWARGESYAHDIINDLNHHVSGWTDWNLILDMQGGPNWAGNVVDAPILVDIVNKRYYKQPMYYYLGHFSKFIRPGSKMIASVSRGVVPLEEVAYLVPAHDGMPATVVVVVLNRDMTGRNYNLFSERKQSAEKYLNLSIPAHAIQTIIIPQV
jgi:glucosylceramidase